MTAFRIRNKIFESQDGVNDIVYYSLDDLKKKRGGVWQIGNRTMKQNYQQAICSPEWISPYQWSTGKLPGTSKVLSLELRIGLMGTIVSTIHQFSPKYQGVVRVCFNVWLSSKQGRFDWMDVGKKWSHHLGPNSNLCFASPTY